MPELDKSKFDFRTPALLGTDKDDPNKLIPVETNPNTGALLVETPIDLALIDNANSGYSNRSFGYVFGRNTNVDNVQIDLWEGPTGVYVFPTVGQQMKFVSSSANDTLAGTGIQKIHIHYLDSNYAVHTETVNMNGTTPVSTVATDIFRINAMHAYQVGSGGVAAGNISLTNTGATVTYAYLTAGMNWARQAIYTVPAGVTGYITHWQASSGSASGNHFTQISLRATCHQGVLLPGVFLLIDEVGTQDGGDTVNYDIPIRIPAMSDVKISAISDTSNANVTALGAIMGFFETNA